MTRRRGKQRAANTVIQRGDDGHVAIEFCVRESTFVDVVTRLETVDSIQRANGCPLPL